MLTPIIKCGQIIIIFSLLVFIGACATSEKSTDDNMTENKVSGTKQIPITTKNRSDSVSVRSEIESRIQPRPNITGKYAVQIGAYTTENNAQKIETITKERFNLLIYIFHDKTDNLYKVFLGDFSTKDEARNFRDNLVRQYPGEYNDAWVSEHPLQ